MEPPSDEDIRRMAKARVAFKGHALVYALVNAMFVAIWFVTSETGTPHLGTNDDSGDYFWPIWPMLGWGIGLAIQGVHAYGGGTGWEEREVAKLREKYGRRR